jgi:pimeloyl-ACP methyl ester carboxylesterase
VGYITFDLVVNAWLVSYRIHAYLQSYIMHEKPTFVLVPGAGHRPECWEKVSTLLTKKGYNSVSVTLPTTLGNSSASFKDDVKAAQDIVQAETSKGLNVIVVVHSYGGIVGQSAMQGFTPSKDAPVSSTDKGYVIGLITMASTFAHTGMAFLDASGGQPPSSWAINPEGFAEIQVSARELFYHDLPTAEGDEWVAKITKQSMRAFTEDREVVYTGWKDVPVWTLITTEDKALPAEAQKMMVAAVKDEADITVREIDSSHSPMLSRPEEVVEFMLEAANAFTK